MAISTATAGGLIAKVLVAHSFLSTTCQALYSIGDSRTSALTAHCFTMPSLLYSNVQFCGFAPTAWVMSDSIGGQEQVMVEY